MMQGNRFFREIEANCWDPSVRVAQMDRHGIDVQVLSTVPVMFSYWAKPAHAFDLSKILNDAIAEVVRERPRRFVGLGTIPLQDPELACLELERCVRELGMPGVQIGSHVGPWNLDAPELFSVFETASRLGACIFVHPWDVVGKERMGEYWLAWLVGMPAETCLAICSILFGGILERLPALRLGFAHGGGSFPGTIGRIEHGFRARPDLCAVRNEVSPRSYLGRFYLDSAVHDPIGLRHLVEIVGANAVFLGSDYPFPLGEQAPGALIESMEGVDAATKARLLGGTALEFLGIDRTRFEG